MIRLFLFGMRIGTIAFVALLFSQVHVGEKRICDHVRDITQSSLVQTPIHWITGKFDFKGGEIHAEDGEKMEETSHARAPSKKKTAPRVAGTSESDVGNTDKDLLSGLLKRPKR